MKELTFFDKLKERFIVKKIDGSYKRTCPVCKSVMDYTNKEKGFKWILVCSNKGCRRWCNG